MQQSSMTSTIKLTILFLISFIEKWFAYIKILALQMYSSGNTHTFDKCKQLCIYYHNKYITRIHLPQSSLWPFCVLSPSSSPAPDNHSSFCYYDFSFPRFHINWMRKCIGFWVCILSLYHKTLESLTTFMFVKCSTIIFFLNNIPLYLSIYLLMDNWVISQLGNTPSLAVFYTKVVWTFEYKSLGELLL